MFVSVCFPNEQGEMVGLDADFVNILAKKYGFRPKWVMKPVKNFELSANDLAVRLASVIVAEVQKNVSFL